MTSLPEPLARTRTLLVDDEAPLRSLLRAVLERSGRYEIVAEAADGRAAVELAAEHHPDLVLLDLSMPVMDGLETLPHLRRSLPEARLVVLSGFAAGGAASSARAAGADAYLEKGLAPRALLAALEDAATGVVPDGATDERRIARPEPAAPSSAEVVARLAHDVRTPLASAVGAMHLLRRTLSDDVPHELRELLARATTSLERVSDTLTAAVEHARTGQAPLDPRVVALQPLAKEVADVVEDPDRRVRVLVPYELEAFVDRGAVARVLTNIVDNALRYGAGPVEITGRTRAGRAVLDVRDHGHGLGRNADALFSPFVRGRRDVSGTGLGLATAADLMRRVGGQLSAFDHPDGGACFRVELPLA
ncbi:response regulator [Egicoccus sp. AB-alg2]|uniref:response regulator n=1 Tax=Egicoccus sp. AB-alg2 TaxID=3242693 RepID=UPI00359D762A